MLALTVNELAAIVSALFGALAFLVFLLMRSESSLRERVARLEESVRALRNTSRKEE